MKEEKVAVSRQTFRRLRKSVGIFLRSPAGGRAKLLLAALLLLMLGINGMNVLNSYVGRYFMSAIERRDWPGFVQYGWLYVAVFAGSTLVGVFFRFTEERLGLHWRNWLTHRVAGLYIDKRIYVRLDEADSVSNPDQRISEDVRALTVSTLSFILMIVNGTVTAISFSGVLWAISPTLFLVAVGYAILGSVLTIFLGRPLIRLNYRQADREADFRSELIRVAKNGMGIAITASDQRTRSRLMDRIDQVVSNMRRITAINRNLSFFTTGYNYMIQLIPILIVAPLFIHGNVEFGVIGQSAMAFATLLGAFSLVVTQFQSISAYASVVARIGEFTEVADRTASRHDKPGIRFAPGADQFEYKDLTLFPADNQDQALIKNLSVTFPRGKHMIVRGSNDVARKALFRASAGLYPQGAGNIICPCLEKVVFLPHRPYIHPGTLREALLAPGHEHEHTDDRILRLLTELNLGETVLKCDGIDTPRPWDDVLSLAEQQLVSVARLILSGARFAFIDRLESALTDDAHKRVLRLLGEHEITCVSFSKEPPEPGWHQFALELNDDGSWSYNRAG